MPGRNLEDVALQHAPQYIPAANDYWVRLMERILVFSSLVVTVLGGLSGMRRGSAATRTRSALVASALEGYDATPETEHKLLEAELSNRVAELERYIPQDDSSPSATMVKAVFDQSREL